MKLPSKVTPYSKSIVFVMVYIMKALNKPGIISISVLELYLHLEDKKGIGITDFTDALVCLFALNKIKLNEIEGTISLC